MKNPIIVFFLLIGCVVFSQEYHPFQSLSEYKISKCERAVTTLEIEDCLMGVAQELDTELERVYTLILNSFDLSDNQQIEERKLLIASQDAYVIFEDASTSLVYQQYFDGSIRNTMSLEKKMALQQNRINELKALYLHIFSKEITAKDLLGTWKLTNGSDLLYEFQKQEDTFIFIAHKEGEKSNTGTFKVLDGYLDLYNEAGNKEMSQWIYMENARTTGVKNNDDLYLYFLRGAGSPKEVFLKL